MCGESVTRLLCTLPDENLHTATPPLLIFFVLKYFSYARGSGLSSAAVDAGDESAGHAAVHCVQCCRMLQIDPWLTSPHRLAWGEPDLPTPKSMASSPGRSSMVAGAGAPLG